MMVRWRISSKSKTSSSWGVRLLPGFMPTTISLLSEPPFTDANGSGDDMSMNRRAVILLGDERDATNGENEHVNYQLFQLEVDSDGSKYPDSDETKYMVKAKLCSEGNLFGSEASPAPVSGLFLASASFDFAKVKPKSSRTLTVDNVYSNDTATKSFLAAVGIVRSPCKGLEAVLISTAGIDNRKEVVSPSKDAFLSKSTSEVSSYWHSHTIPFNPLLMDKNKPVESFFVWSIELCDGTLVCWSVPYIHGSLPKVCLFVCYLMLPLRRSSHHFDTIIHLLRQSLLLFKVQTLRNITLMPPTALLRRKLPWTIKARTSCTNPCLAPSLQSVTRHRGSKKRR